MVTVGFSNVHILIYGLQIFLPLLGWYVITDAVTHHHNVAPLKRRFTINYQVRYWIKHCLKKISGRQLLSTKWTRVSGNPFVMVAANAVS